MFTRRRNSSSDAAAATAASPPALFARPIQNSIRPPGYTRQQHIDSYMKDAQLAPSTRKVSEDDTTFDTVFQSVAGDTLILRVHWPVHGQRPPSMTLAGVEARHDWLDSRMRITGYPPIQSHEAWRDSTNLLLGEAVRAVVTHLQLHPPQIVQFVDPGLIAIQPKPVNGTSNNNNKYNQTKHNNGGRGHHHHHHTSSSISASATTTPPPPAYSDSLMTQTPTIPKKVSIPLPTIPNTFPEMDDFSRDELEKIIDDELEFMAFCNRLPITKEYYKLQQEFMLKENATKAKERVDSYEEEMKRLHKEVQELQKDLQEKTKSFQQLEKKQDAFCKPPDRNRLLRDLSVAKKEAFDESEQIAEEWLESDDCSNATNDFVKRFIDSRKIHHTRAAKLEILEIQD